MLTVVCGFAACSSIDCNLEGRVLCNYELQDKQGNAITANVPISITLHFNDGNDSVYINKATSVSDLRIPMSYIQEADTMTMTLHTTDSTLLTDRMVISKTNSPLFENVDCAPRYSHSLIKAETTHNVIDTLIINNVKVSNNATVKNIFIRIRNI